jgi:hypothetical protein
MSANTHLDRRILRQMLIPLMILLLVGCDEHERLVQTAREAANRQAEQNKEIAHQNREIAETARHLVEADGQSRKELTALQHDLQAQQAEVAKQQDALEAERRQIANQRQRESLLVPVLESFAVVLIGGLVLAYCCYLASGLRGQQDVAEDLNGLLLCDLVAEQPILTPPAAKEAVAVKRLPGPVAAGDEEELAEV